MNRRHTCGFGFNGGKNLLNIDISLSFVSFLGFVAFGTANLVVLKIISISFGALRRHCRSYDQVNRHVLL